MIDIEEYYREFISDIQNEADVSGLIIVEAFFEKMVEFLVETGELDTADRCFFESKVGNQNLRVDGYGGDPRDADGVLSLVICDFQITEDLEDFNGEQLKRLFKHLVNFLQFSRKPSFRDGLEEVGYGFGLADLISTTWNNVSKIKLILLTNRKYKSKLDAVPAGSIDGIPVTYNIWDFPRIYRYVASGQAREDLVVDFKKDYGGVVPVLKASFNDAPLESYIAVIPGTQLSEIYDKWGTRLLESNVRSFLQARGKVNRGIRDTIKTEPEMFFSYNNGVTATADKVVIEQTENGTFMTRADNLQIVNGGQTTASLHAARKLSPEQLENVFVQMKLTIVPPSKSEEIVPKISEFANSQNKVNAADFFSNHPFHVRMEEFSRRVLAPGNGESRRESKWFYERARGQFNAARGNLTPTERKKFDLEYPRAQFFTKTDLAKFEYSYRGHPEVVNNGAQKNFAAFAKKIGEEWSRSETKFDEIWYKRLIAKALIFKSLEKAVPKQEWYEGGYRVNIVTYAFAKLAHDAKELELVIDLDAVWKAQDVSSELEAALLVAAIQANNAITNPPEGVHNMSEWAKKQACWAGLKTRELTYGPGLKNILIERELANTTVRSARSSKALTKGIEAQATVMEAGAEFWENVMRWGMERRLIGPKEAGVLAKCAAIPTVVPSEKQCIIAVDSLSKLQENGF